MKQFIVVLISLSSSLLISERQLNVFFELKLEKLNTHERVGTKAMLKKEKMRRKNLFLYINTEKIIKKS